eukprot:gene18365-5136_t
MIRTTFDTSDCNLGRNPIIVTSLGGTSHHWKMSGSNSVYGSKTPYTVYVGEDSTHATVSNAANDNYHINYIGLPTIQPHNADGICTGDTGASITNWVRYDESGSNYDSYVDVDTRACGFSIDTTPIYIPSLHCSGHCAFVQGASEIYTPTATGFRVYLTSSDRSSKIDTYTYSWESDWHVQWVAKGAPTSTTAAATTTTATTTATTATATTTTATTYGDHCPTSCTQTMYENDVCDPECNSYVCRYDYGVCAHSMANDLQRARTLAIIGKSNEALLLFEDLCNNFGDRFDIRSFQAPESVGLTEHEARIREFEAQQSFSAISCSAAEHLRLGNTFYGRAPNEVSGTMTWSHLKEKVNEKIGVLETMDVEIANIQQLSATFAATERIETFTANRLSEVAEELTEYIGESVAGLEQKLDDQTNEMRLIAARNEERLARAAELQQRILFQTEFNGESLNVLHAKVDHIAEGVDDVLEDLHGLGAKVDFLTAYTMESHEILSSQLHVIDETTRELSDIQRTTLAQVRQNSASISSLSAQTRDVMSAVLDNGKRLNDLSAGQRNLLNEVLGNRKTITSAVKSVEAQVRANTQRIGSFSKTFNSVMSRSSTYPSVAYSSGYRSSRMSRSSYSSSSQDNEDDDDDVGLSSCIKPVTRIAAGAARGGLLGGFIATGKSIVSGSASDCVNGAIKFGKTAWDVGTKVFKGDWSGAWSSVKSYMNWRRKRSRLRMTRDANTKADLPACDKPDVVDCAEVSIDECTSSFVKKGCPQTCGACTVGTTTANTTTARLDEIDFTFQDEEGVVWDLAELMEDTEALVDAAMNFHDAADGLYFNTSKGIAVDIGMLSHPEIEAKYSSETKLFSESLLAVQAYAQQRNMLEAQARTNAYLTDNVGRCLLDGECDLKDRVNRYDLALGFIRMKRSSTVFEILEAFVEMNNAFQYEFLKPKIDFLLTESPSLADLQTLMTRFSDAHTTALTTLGGVPQSASVYYTFSETDEPEAFQMLKETGVGFFTIPSADQSRYRDIRVSSASVQAYVYPTNSIDANSATVQISKGGYSTFFPIETFANPITYLHTDIMDSRIYSFVYNPQTCESISQPCTTQRCSNAEFLSVSPYGEWRVEVTGETFERIQSATDVRMAFTVTWHTSSDDQPVNYTDAMFGNDGCSEGPVCFVQQNTKLIANDECEGPQPIPSTGMSPGGKAGLGIGLVILFALIGFAVLRAKGVSGRERRPSGFTPEGIKAYSNPAYGRRARDNSRC